MIKKFIYKIILFFDNCFSSNLKRLPFSLSKFKNQITGVLILAYKNKLRWHFDSIIIFEDYISPSKIPPVAFSLALLEFSNTSNSNNINFEEIVKNKNHENDYKGRKNYFFESSRYLIIEKLNYEKFYDQCLNFKIIDWYNFFDTSKFKCKKNDNKLFSEYYPPEYFWGYIGALILFIQTNPNFDESLKEQILINWRDQIITLLDQSYLNQGYLLHRQGYLQPKSDYRNSYEKIICDFSEIGSDWLVHIAPFLKPYNKDQRINNLLNRFNALGIIHHRLIEDICVKIERSNQEYSKIVRHGGFNLYDALKGGNFYSLRKEMAISLQYILDNGWIDDLIKKDDDFFIKTINMWGPEDKILNEINPDFIKKLKPLTII